MQKQPKQTIRESYKNLLPWNTSLRSGFLTFCLWNCQAALHTTRSLSGKVMYLGLLPFLHQGLQPLQMNPATEQTFDLYLALLSWVGRVYHIKQSSASWRLMSLPSSLPAHCALWQSQRFKIKISCVVLLWETQEPLSKGCKDKPTGTVSVCKASSWFMVQQHFRGNQASCRTSQLRENQVAES